MARKEIIKKFRVLTLDLFREVLIVSVADSTVRVSRIPFTISGLQPNKFAACLIPVKMKKRLLVRNAYRVVY